VFSDGGCPLYLTLQGTAVVASKQRRWVDPHWFRGKIAPQNRLELVKKGSPKVQLFVQSSKP